MSDLSSICEQAAKIGGKVLIELSGRVGCREKGINDLVTEADLRSQTAIQQFLDREVPGSRFIGEEDGTWRKPDAEDLVWLVDPLDGTTNYVHGFPHFCVSIAALRGNHLLASAVYDPVMDECFAAADGNGAVLNGTPIHVSRAESVSDSLIAASLPAVVSRQSPELERFLRAGEHARSIRRTGSAALNLSYVASGRFDAYWATTLKPWDAAAGALLILEAGGCISDLDGSPFQVYRPDILAAASEALQRSLQGMLRI